MKNRYGYDIPGDSVNQYSVVSAQFGGGVAVQLSRHLFLRPQIRYQHRSEFSVLGADRNLPSPVSLCVALGYRF
jgi:hypothetical protein